MTPLVEQGAVEFLRALKEQRRYRAIDRYYPETGPLRRELYPRHIEVFAKGKEFRERAVIAGNRTGKCTTAGTVIETGSGPVSMGALWLAQREFTVKAWDGERVVEAPASIPFRMGVEECYRVEFSDGSFLEGAGRHRIWTSKGWRELGDALFDLESIVLVNAENRILAVHSIGPKEVFDFTVPELHNYVASNLINHNSEGIGAYETVCHLTGQYPAFWPGRKFDKPVVAWASGDTAITVRDSIQAKMMGGPGQLGTGMVPKDCIVGKPKPKAGIADAFDFVSIRHASGGLSTLFLKSYATGREAFQATEVDFIWLDEECPMDIYTECLTRTATTRGAILLTFTPLSGPTEVVLTFWNEADRSPSKWMTMISWDDVPHLDEKTKAELLASYPAFQRDARTKGIPMLGAGAIYDPPLDRLLVDDFALPGHWARGYGLDVGWNRTAAVWGALDRESDTMYLYSEHYVGQAEPSTHAAAIHARGKMKGWIDPASCGRSQLDGRRLIDQYRKSGLDLQHAQNVVEAGIHAVRTRMVEGRLKVFKSLRSWQEEYSMYHRDGNGKVVKAHDHLMDAMRYLVMATPEMGYAVTSPEHEAPKMFLGGGWMH